MVINDTLTAKQRKFLRYLIRTFSPTEAAMKSFNCKDRLVARVIASQLLSKLNITMNELMDKCGLDVQQDIEDLKRLRNAKITKHFAYEGVVCDEKEYEDNITQLKALELTLKLKGELKEENKINVNINVQLAERIKRARSEYFEEIQHQ